MSIENEKIETSEQITVHFEGGNNCTLGYPKLEAVNIQHQTAYDKTIALIASCLLSAKKDGEIQSYGNLTLQQKIVIVRSWSYAQMEAVTKALPSFLGEYYLKAGKRTSENDIRN
jgi:hypothetical protein